MLRAHLSSFIKSTLPRPKNPNLGKGFALGGYYMRNRIIKPESVQAAWN